MNMNTKMYMNTKIYKCSEKLHLGTINTNDQYCQEYLIAVTSEETINDKIFILQYKILNIQIY